MCMWVCGIKVGRFGDEGRKKRGVSGRLRSGADGGRIRVGESRRSSVGD